MREALGLITYCVSDMKSDRPQNKHLRPAKPGEVRNPNGRPVGSRNKLGEAFLAALHLDFQEHGTSVIERVRIEEPAQYMRVVAGLLPKEVKIDASPLSEMSDDELTRLIDIIRSTLPVTDPADGGTRPSPVTH